MLTFSWASGDHPDQEASESYVKPFYCESTKPQRHVLHGRDTAGTAGRRFCHSSAEHSETPGEFCRELYVQLS